MSSILIKTANAGCYFMAGVLTVLTCLAPVSALGQESGRITTIHIVTPEWEGITRKDGTGLYFDIIRAVYEPVGIQMKHEIVPWKRAILKIRHHQADALPGGYYISREDVDDLFPLHPIDVEITSAVFKKGKIANWEGQKSIAGKRGIWFRGYDYHKYMDAKVRFDEIDEAKQGWNLIDADRYDFYMDALKDIENYIKTHQVDRGRYEIRPVIRKPLYLRFANTPKSKKLIGIYDRRISVLSDSGELKRLFDKRGYRFPGFEKRK